MGESIFNEQKCRICGCTWDNACPGGCYWVEDDLCSACASKQYTKLLDINPTWLIDYLAEMIAENDDAFEKAIEIKDLDDVKSIIEKHIY